VLLAIPAVTPAQGATKPLLDKTFSIPSGEFARVWLAANVTYRADISGGGISLLVRPVESGVQDAEVRPVLSGSAASGSSLYDITPRADGMYEFRSAGGNSGASVRVRLVARGSRDPAERRDTVVRRDSTP
jgi:hypothetical protein